MLGSPLLAHRRILLTALALAAALAAPGAARAQTLTVAPSTFGAKECNDANSNVAITWDFGTTFITGTAVSVILTTDSGCSTTSGSPALSPDQTSTGTLTIRPSAFVFSQTPADCTAKVTSAQPATIYVCAKAGTTQTLVQPVKFALQPPTPPASLAGREGDQHVKLSWAQGATTEDISSYDLYAAELGNATIDAGTPDAGSSADAGTSDGGSSATQSTGDVFFAGQGPIETGIADTNADVQSIGGQALQNEVTYVFAVRATDKYGNISTLSDVALATPKAIDDFYTHYRDAGGTATGGSGCASAGSTVWALLALGAVLFVVARRRKAGALVLALAALGAGGARAQEVTTLNRPQERAPRRLLFALKIDRYDPQIDTESSLQASGARPYHDIFHGRAPLRWQVEVDWEAAHPFGSLLVGGTLGYWQNIGKGLDHATQVPSEDTALLDVIPFGAIVTYRFDWAADRLNIPVIPYGQLGLQAALWASFNGRGDVVQRPSNGGRGSGWTTGWTAALGVALPLDFLDPSLAREAYNDVRLQRTSLFAEYGWTNLSSFGKSGALILSDRAWRFGLSLEF